MRTRVAIYVLSIILISGAWVGSLLLVMISMMLFFILGVAALWSKHSLDNIHYQRCFHYKRAFPGETSHVEFVLDNNKILPITWLRIADNWPDAVALDDNAYREPAADVEYTDLIHLFGLRWFGRMRRKYEMTFQNRGVHPVGPVHFESGDPFGIFDKHNVSKQIEYLTVYPRILPLSELKLKPEDPFGDLASRHRIYDDPSRPIGVRAYHPEDGFRRVHWPATARTGELQTRILQPVSAQVMMVCLNVATFPDRWQGVNPALLERLVNIAATVVYKAIQDGYSVGLLSDGGMAHSDQPYSLAPGRSPQQLGWLLQALAGVMPISQLGFEKYILKAMPSLPYGSTLVIISAIYSELLSETLLRLKHYRGSITLLSLDEKTPAEIPGIRVIQLPESEEEAV
ncbi:MAG: DUF58 domain-containing protein [Anaerolineaceae bacterium]|nr:DUF58 domain-containing protein [Anaerolineaceae bacterium]MBN2676513.1 DUF58 domain-containing protein [Anaerolineaceae bacterium]